VLLRGTAGLRWGEAVALRVPDVDFLRRRIELHRNAVTVGGHAVVGTLKSGKARTVLLAGFVIDELAATCEGTGRDELIWPSATGWLSRPPGAESWLAGAVARCQKADPTFRQDHGARSAPYCGLAGDLGGGKREGCSANAWALRRP
jgi:integrase